MSKLNINHVIVCDDIRTENNRKIILIGIYAGDIIPTGFPSLLPVCLYFMGRSSGEIKVMVSVKIELIFENESDNNRVYEQDFEFERDLQNNSEFTIIVQGVPLEIIGPCIMKIKTKEEGKRWKEITTKKILANPSST